MVFFKDKESLAEALKKNISAFGNEAFTEILLPRDTKFVITGVPVIYDLKEITQEISETFKVSDLSWVRSKNKSRGNVVGFAQNTTDLEKELIKGEVRIGFRNFPLKKFKAKAITCFKCQKRGHTSIACRQEKDKCKRCGGSHRLTQCQKKGKMPIGQVNKPDLKKYLRRSQNLTEEKSLFLSRKRQRLILKPNAKGVKNLSRRNLRLSRGVLLGKKRARSSGRRLRHFELNF
ncbi:hypothetical protein NGRA_2936 [Nosema granulosis]|uniref:CCHC-type domain-containing protein n=1 Tax=Nosema granulosis TaxID=83296 RepID=A0A9P6KX86_9MICR|nr:hypothetical protein NGRA_2936 [Nosema granulosis]